MRGPWIAAGIAAGLLAGAVPARAAEGGGLRCTLTFDLDGWSAFYKTARGQGTVRCRDGQSVGVRLSAYGGGFSFGRAQIRNGKGSFSGLSRLSDVFGSYVQATAHGGVGTSGEASALTKGGALLTFSGAGPGNGFGFAFGAFRVERR